MYNADVPNKEVLTIRIGGAVLDNSNIIEFYFMEDIFSAAMVGSLSFFDKAGALEIFPITGHEIVTVQYGDKRDKALMFNIFNIKRVSPVDQLSGSKNTYIEMLLMDPIFFPMTLQKYSRSWATNTLLSDVVKDICEYMVHRKTFFRWEDSREKIGTSANGDLASFYMPYWTPLEAIKWLSKRCSGAKFKTPGYLFFNSPKGLNFVTLENLFQTEQLEKDGKRKTRYYKFTSDEYDDDYKILGWSLHPLDYQSLYGLKGAHKLGFDFSTKQLLDEEYDYKTALNSYTLMGKKSLYPDISDSSVRFDLTGDTSTRTLQNIFYTDFIKRYLGQLTCMITVRGNERRYAGMVVNVMWPSAIEKELVHRSLEGTWFVTAITHYFNLKTQPFYQQKMTLVKTGYANSQSSVLMGVSKYRKSSSEPMGG